MTLNQKPTKKYTLRSNEMNKQLENPNVSDMANLNPLIKFVQETEDGKFTSEKPNIKYIIYRQTNPNFIQNLENNDGEILLFGITR